jgi:hypothetical protein
MRFSLQEHCSSEASACQSTVLAVKATIKGQPNRFIGIRDLFPVRQCRHGDHKRGLILNLGRNERKQPAIEVRTPRSRSQATTEHQFLGHFSTLTSEKSIRIFKPAFSPRFHPGANSLVSLPATAPDSTTEPPYP